MFIDGEHAIHDSWKVAEYLGNYHPDAPSLFHSKTGKLWKCHASWVGCMMMICSEVDNLQQHRCMLYHILMHHADQWQLNAQDIMQSGLP